MSGRAGQATKNASVCQQSEAGETLSFLFRTINKKTSGNGPLVWKMHLSHLFNSPLPFFQRIIIELLGEQMGV